MAVLAPMPSVERGDGRQRERRALREHAQRVLQVLEKRLEHRGVLRTVRLWTRVVGIAQAGEPTSNGKLDAHPLVSLLFRAAILTVRSPCRGGSGSNGCEESADSCRSAPSGNMVSGGAGLATNAPASQSSANVLADARSTSAHTLPPKPAPKLLAAKAPRSRADAASSRWPESGCRSDARRPVGIRRRSPPPRESALSKASRARTIAGVFADEVIQARRAARRAASREFSRHRGRAQRDAPSGVDDSAPASDRPALRSRSTAQEADPSPPTTGCIGHARRRFSRRERPKARSRTASRRARGRRRGASWARTRKPRASQAGR